MADSSVDYGAVLADLKARRAQIDQAIATIEALAASGGFLGSSGGQATDQIRSDTFYNLSVPQAVKKYLGMTRREPKSPQLIVEALKKGGQEQAAYTNVYTALKRLRVAGEVEKLPSGDWGLAEWYEGGSARKGNRPKGNGEKVVREESDDSELPAGQDE